MNICIQSKHINRDYKQSKDKFTVCSNVEFEHILEYVLASSIHIISEVLLYARYYTRAGLW